MLFGMTRGEIGLVVFIFVLVLGAGLLPPLGERIGAWFSRKRNG